jgi:hypothetical protein
MKLSWLFTLLLVTTLVCSCSKEEAPTPKIHYIGYGTSFGECLGYCVHQMKVDDFSVSLKRNGWDEYGLLPEIQCGKRIESYEFISLKDSLDLAVFFNMEETIGCPDCTDGGAEWVEVSYDTLVHRVTFPYMSEPPELAAIVPMLREMMASIPGCEE